MSRLIALVASGECIESFYYEFLDAAHLRTLEKVAKEKQNAAFFRQARMALKRRRSKTRCTLTVVQIPIFPLLQEVLDNVQPHEGPFVFPEQEMMYQLNPDSITQRVRKVFRAAGFFDPVAGEAAGPTAPSRGAIQKERINGLRKASVRDFHSFRVTWVTLALNAGVPLEIVQKVTGHRTAGIVMKHYFQPGREDFRRTLTSRLILPVVRCGRVRLLEFASPRDRPLLAALMLPLLAAPLEVARSTDSSQTGELEPAKNTSVCRSLS